MLQVVGRIEETGKPIYLYQLTKKDFLKMKKDGEILVCDLDVAGFDVSSPFRGVLAVAVADNEKEAVDLVEERLKIAIKATTEYEFEDSESDPEEGLEEAAEESPKGARSWGQVFGLDRHQAVGLCLVLLAAVSNVALVALVALGR